MKLFKQYFIYILLLIIATILCFFLDFAVENSFARHKAESKISGISRSQLKVDSLINEIDTLRLYDDDELVKEIIYNQLTSFEGYNNEYIWINQVTDYNGGDNYGFRFFHPNYPETEGHPLSTLTEDQGNTTPYAVELDGINKDGFIFFDYYFKNYLNDITERKYTYAKLYKDFNWIIACGIPESDLYREAINVYEAERKLLHVFYLSVFGLYLLITYFIYTHNKRTKEREKLILKNIATNAKTDAKSEFLATVSHELRTPLTAIIGLNELLQDNVNDEEIVMDYSSKIQESSSMLLSIINDVLDMSAIEKGKLKIDNVDFNIKRIIYSVSDIYYNLAQKKGLDFEVLLSNIEEEELIGDGHRINQILLNLLSNALKFTNNGKITVRLSEKKIDKKHVELFIEVQDTGCGMTEEMQGRLFQQFEQADASVAKYHGGSGLGLSITKYLVEAMNGSIDVKSDFGSGTVFKVRLPIEVSELTEEVILDITNQKAFIVDDDSSTCEYISKIFDSWKVENISFTSSISALEYLRKHPSEYTIFILDYKIPEIDGVELSTEINKLNKKAMIIMLSGYNIGEVKKKGLKHINSYLQKPIFKSDLYNNIVNKLSTYKTVVKDKENIDFTGKTVLSVEDNQINQLIITKMLESFGIETILAKDGLEALEFMRTNPDREKIAMIFMDIRMPILNGLDTTKRIRQFNKNIPIIALSANAFEEDVRESLKAGMNNHLAKPVNRAKLTNVLKKYLGDNNED